MILLLALVNFILVELTSIGEELKTDKSMDKEVIMMNILVIFLLVLINKVIKMDREK